MQKTTPYLLTLTLVFILISNRATSQISSLEDDGTPKTFNYKLVLEAPVIECNIIGVKKDDAVIQIVPRNSIFTLVGRKNADSVIVRFWTWNEDTELRKAYNYVDEATKETKYFLLAFQEFNDKAVKRYSTVPTFTAGTVIVPIKMRFNDFDFSKDVTIGPTAGARFRLSHYSNNYLNALIGFGITSITLDSASTAGKIKKTSDRPALTPSFGLVFEFIQNVQVGLFAGKDYISKKEDVDWVYQGKTWFSLGLGITILSRQESASKNNSGNQDKK